MVACVEASDELQTVPARPISPLARLGAPKKMKHPITIMPPRRSEACPVSSVNPNHPTASIAKDVPSDPVTVLSIQTTAVAMLLESIVEGAAIAVMAGAGLRLGRSIATAAKKRAEILLQDVQRAMAREARLCQVCV